MAFFFAFLSTGSPVPSVDVVALTASASRLTGDDVEAAAAAAKAAAIGSWPDGVGTVTGMLTPGGSGKPATVSLYGVPSSPGSKATTEQ